MLIDSHCHLDKLDLSPYEGSLEKLIRAAADLGVKQILSIAVDLDNAKDVLALAQRQGVYATAGVHPLHSEGLLQEPGELKAHLQEKKVIAVGETGLDYFYETDKVTQSRQMESFCLHLNVAGEQGLPVIVHTRDAREDTLAAIRAYGNDEVGGVLHCFTESYDMAKAALDKNYLISISGIVSFRNAESLRDVVKKVPISSLLVETDAPYLAPIPYRGKKNEPKYVVEVAQYVADIKGISYNTLLEKTAENFFSKFRKASPDECL